MPRVKASMKDVSTDFSPIEPGIHRYEIEEVTETTDEESQRTVYAIKSKVMEVLEDGNAKDVGRTVTDRVHIHKKDGTINDMGVAQLKRYFEVTVGQEQAESEDADTDWLKGQQFRGQTAIEAYKVKNNLTGEDEVRKRNVIERLAPI